MTLRIFGGFLKGRLLKTPKGSSTRPTQGNVREAVFNICQNDIAGSRFLDLFAGSGAMGLEAISRGAAQATLIEQNRNAIACIKENIISLHVEKEVVLISIEAGRALVSLAGQGVLFDIVYIDPPYDSVTSLESLIPLLAPRAILFLEERNGPKTPHRPSTHPSLHLKDTRRFGTALLSIYHLKNCLGMG